jgi:hypothetical protein
MRLYIRVLVGIVLLAGAALAGNSDGAKREVRQAPARHPGGIWKAAVPPNAMLAEFGGHDPIGLAAGAKIKADCSINWTDPDTAKLYCFASATSQSYFQDWPKRNIERAGRAWGGAPGGS